MRLALLVLTVCLGCDPYAYRKNGPDPTPEPTPEAGPYIDLFASNYAGYAMKRDSTLLGWGRASMLDFPDQSVPWTQVSVMGTAVCGLHTDGKMNCWGENQDTINEQIPPDHRYSGVATGGIGGSTACGILEGSGELECWEAPIDSVCYAFDRLPETLPTPLHSLVIAYSCGSACALDQEGLAHCWGIRDLGLPLAPSNVPFDSISFPALNLGCGVRSEDKLLQCWGDSFLADPALVPDEELLSIAGSSVSMWGITKEKKLMCWGNEGYCSEYSLPHLLYQKLVGFGGAWCGLTTRGNIHCNSIYEGDPVGAGPVEH